VGKRLEILPTEPPAEALALAIATSPETVQCSTMVGIKEEYVISMMFAVLVTSLERHVGSQPEVTITVAMKDNEAAAAVVLEREVAADAAVGADIEAGIAMNTEVDITVAAAADIAAAVLTESSRVMTADALLVLDLRMRMMSMAGSMYKQTKKGLPMMMRTLVLSRMV